MYSAPKIFVSVCDSVPKINFQVTENLVIALSSVSTKTIKLTFLHRSTIVVNVCHECHAVPFLSSRLMKKTMPEHDLSLLEVGAFVFDSVF